MRATPRNLLWGILLGLVFGIAPAVGVHAGDPAKPEPKPVSFRTAKATKGDLTATVKATGIIEPETTVEVGAEVAGRIVSVSADYGSMVKKDDVLAKIENSSYATKVEEEQASLQLAVAKFELAKVKLQRAENDLQRTLAAFKAGAAVQSDVDTAKGNLDEAKAAIEVAAAEITRCKATLNQAKINLDATIIRAPIDGVVIVRHASVGQVVAGKLDTSSFLFLLGDLQKLEVWASVDEAEIGQVKPNQAVRFTVAAFPDKVFEGIERQVRLNANMTQNKVTYTVVVTVKDTDTKLLPYLTAETEFVTSKRTNALLVPNAALRFHPLPEWVSPSAVQPVDTFAPKRRESTAKRTVWVPEGHFAHPVEVQVGPSDGTNTEITGGDLKEGQEVVVGQSAS